MADEQTVHFGPYRLDPANARLWHETHPLRLTPKAFQVLCYLTERPGQLVTKDELLQAVWAETIISEATLTSAIQEIRKALADNAREPQYVETVHRRGFRFIAAVTVAPVPSSEVRVPSQEAVGSRQEDEANQKANGKNQKAKVEEQEIERGTQTEKIETEADKTELNDVGLRTLDVQTPTPSTQHPTPNAQSSALSPQHSRTPGCFRWWQVLLLVVVLVLGGGLAANWRLVRLVVASYIPPPVPEPLALPLPDKPSLVVLPLVNLSGDASQEYFSDGITDDLINTLAQFPDLFVIARQSAFTYKGKTVKEQDVGRELGVRYVLTGSVRRAGEQVRMNVQLVDATTGEQLWAERYDRPFTEIFALQDDLVQKLATTLTIQLSLLKQGFYIAKTTDNVEAYDYQLRGMAHWSRASKKDNLQARELCEKALTLDPQYAAAYACIGFTYYMEWVMQWNRDPQTLEQVLEYGQKAVTLNDSYHGGHQVLALAYARKAQLDRALSEVERVITLQPNAAVSYAVQAEVLMVAGRPRESLQSIQHGLRLNPRGDVTNFAMLGFAYHYTEYYAESITAYKRALAITPFYPLAYPLQALNYTSQWFSQRSHDPKILDQAYDAAQNAIALNDAFPVGHSTLGFVYLLQKHYDNAIAEFERTVALDENFVCGQMLLAFGLGQVGRVKEAVQVGERALSLKALPPDDRCLFGVADAYTLAGRLEEAAALHLRTLKQFPNLLVSHLMLADLYSQLGREAEAQAAAAEVLRLNPQFSLEVHKQRVAIKDPVILELHIAALRKAGLR